MDKQDGLAETQAQDTGVVGILGDAIALMMHSKSHRHLFLSDLEWLVLPPLLLRQVRVFRNMRQPLAYVSWAFLNEETEKRLLNGQGRLSPRDWKTGTRPWIIDCVTAGGNVYQFLAALQEQVFEDQEVRLLQPRKDQKGWEGVLLKEALQNAKKPAGQNREQH